MSAARMRSLGILCVLFISAGCQHGIKKENAALRGQNQELQSRLSDTEGRLRAAPDPSQLQAMQNELAARDARIRELEAQLRRSESASAGGLADPALDGIQASYDKKRGELTVNLPADILFASGSADLKSTAKSTLDKLIRAIKKDYPGKAVRVEGHTDPDPIVRTRSRWTDNLDLSQNRAAAVARYLIAQGVSRRNIATVGYGDTHPKGSKAASRRVEIVVVVG